MKLRLFREIFSKDDYYTEIYQDEFCRLVYHCDPMDAVDSMRTSLSFTDEEKKILIKAFPDNKIVFKKKKTDCSCEVKSFRFNWRSIYIDKLEDDWYLVAWPITEEDEAYYKCDQWEGLIELLKDKSLILESVKDVEEYDYKEITADKYSDYLLNTNDKLTESEIMKIMVNLDRVYRNFWYKNIDNGYSINIYDTWNKSFNFKMFKGDDYYFVWIYNRFFKCDDIKGFQKFLDEKKDLLT